MTRKLETGARVVVIADKKLDTMFIGCTGTVILPSMGDKRYTLVKLDQPIANLTEWAFRKSAIEVI
jgi:hypothetical protein